MKAGEVKLSELLFSKLQFRVPLFQRTYDWKLEQWEQLWDDILAIYEMEERRSHFIGAIVTQQLDGAPERVKPYLLIDGQQRLTTVLVLLAGIRKKAIDSGEVGLAEEIENTCLTNKIFNPLNDEMFKLRPTQRDRKPFAAIMNNDAPPETENNVYKAFNYLIKALETNDNNGNPINLSHLKQSITDYLELVSITLEQQDSPHKIFESLNNAGMALGSSDLIRNFVFMHILDEEKAEEAYKLHWFPMQEATGAKLDDFFWRYLMMDGSLPRSDDTFTEMKKHLGQQLSANEATSAMASFASFAWHYCRLHQLTRADKEIFNQQAKRLSKWEVEVADPFLMKALEWAEEGAITWEMLVESMKMIESFVVRRAVCGVPTNRLRSLFTKMSAQAHSSDFVEWSRGYLLSNEWPDDKGFRNSFAGYRLYSNRLNRTNLVLQTLELDFGHREHPDFNGQISIEHVMPQTLTDEWKEMLGSDANEVHSKWLHTPGNLTLTGYNSELGNYSFDKKKELLTNSNFALSQSILQREVWNEDIIKARGEALAERAVRLWPR